MLQTTRSSQDQYMQERTSVIPLYYLPRLHIHKHMALTCFWLFLSHKDLMGKNRKQYWNSLQHWKGRLIYTLLKYYQKNSFSTIRIHLFQDNWPFPKKIYLSLIEFTLGKPNTPLAQKITFLLKYFNFFKANPPFPQHIHLFHLRLRPWSQPQP